MKNIHLLPTENSSRLSYNENGVLKLNRLQWRKGTQNIYITSDEEIKEGDWVIKKYETKFPKSKANEVLQVNKINTNNGYLPNGNYYNFSNYLTVVVYDRPFQGSNDNDISRKSFNNGFKKIILTTDQDLIKDGVQAIDDEFLEWFVKNPSCEEVEVIKEQYHQFVGMKKLPLIPNYKIIIPKEEIYFDFTGELDGLPTSSDAINYSLNAFKVPKEYFGQEEPKQETLEEFAERLCPNKQVEYDMIIEGAKWQQEQDNKLYSEEEVRKMFSRYNEVIAHRDIEEWQPWIDKQFKNK